MLFECCTLSGDVAWGVLVDLGSKNLWIGKFLFWLHRYGISVIFKKMFYIYIILAELKVFNIVLLHLL